jgi:hypothetical protein
MTQRDPEYDRFGPWVVEISDEDPPPPLFVPYLTRTDQPLVSVKIPRRIARRDAHPGMDLYDYLVSLYDQELVILERVDHSVRTQSIPYRDVRHLILRDTLLQGSLHLATPGRAYDLPFSTVSRDVMVRVVDLIRERYVPTDGTYPAVTPVDVRGLSFYFEGLLGEERTTGSGMQPVAAQADTPMRIHERAAWRRLLFGIVDKRLLESVHLTDGRELQIISRGQHYAYRWQAIYGRHVCYIPVAHLERVEWQDEGPESAVIRLTLRTGAGAREHLFTLDNPTIDAYRSTLARLTGGR